MKLENQVAFITGASGGIGGEIAMAFAQEGADVALAARRVEKMEILAEKIRGLGRKALVFRCDVTNDSDILDTLRSTEKELGPIDVLVNNAGIVSFEAVHELPDEVWDRTMQINAKAPFVAIREVLPSMIGRKKGKIINVASVSGKIGLAYRSAYAASKHAVLGLTRSLSAEVAPFGITANCICPTFVDTEMFEESIQKWADETGKSYEEQREELRNRVPMKRFIEAAECVPLALLLASDDSNGITGQAINVDGGFVQY
ncbi:MAG: SDR family NAD(P)-dependent oxidoreductase [Nitrospinota bacterium]|nr:SDR family NAD(P)-dependent oxidoreductase [Nitrospinota bacterium]